jgi:hypothetical protein
MPARDIAHPIDAAESAASAFVRTSPRRSKRGWDVLSRQRSRKATTVRGAGEEASEDSIATLAEARALAVQLNLELATIGRPSGRVGHGLGHDRGAHSPRHSMSRIWVGFYDAFVLAAEIPHSRRETSRGTPADAVIALTELATRNGQK